MNKIIALLNRYFKYDSAQEVWRYEGCGVAYLQLNRVECFFKIDRDFYIKNGRVDTIFSSQADKDIIYDIEVLQDRIEKFFNELKELKKIRRKKMIEEL